MASLATNQPVLARVPDARKSPIPLVDPILLGYLSFLLGVPFAAACGTINALFLRRWLLGLESAAMGALAWFAFAPSMLYLLEQTRDVNVSFIILRLGSLAVGALLGWRQWPHVRGHLFLQGKTVPVLWGVIGGIVIGSQLSMSTLLTLMGMPS